jgi:hypothetical protein
VARFKKYNYNQKRLIAVSFAEQIIAGTFEHALDYLIDNDVDLSIFEKRYSNDETGAPAYDFFLIATMDGFEPIQYMV